MHFLKGYIYHIYNQGNNRQRIFLNRDNYLFFLQKIKIHISPFGDILAWCLMPNHFHLMLLVRKIEIRAMNENYHSLKKSTGLKHKKRSLNESIAICLRSYTRAYNNMHGSTGALFRENTKAECINCPEKPAPAFFIKNGVTEINIKNPEKQYPQICFEYIHDNPVKASLAENSTDWEFSSAKDFAGVRNGRLINKEVARQYVKFNP